MVFEVISILLLIDSLGGLIVSFTKIGDNSIEQNVYVRRYMPMKRLPEAKEVFQFPSIATGLGSLPLQGQYKQKNRFHSPLPD
jgi:hypothetical protein